MREEGGVTGEEGAERGISDFARDKVKFGVGEELENTGVWVYLSAFK